MTGFEGIGDFDSNDPWQRHIAHQAAKGNYPPTKKVSNMPIMMTEVRRVKIGDMLSTDGSVVREIQYDPARNTYMIRAEIPGRVWKAEEFNANHKLPIWRERS